MAALGHKAQRPCCNTASDVCSAIAVLPMRPQAYARCECQGLQCFATACNPAWCHSMLHVQGSMCLGRPSPDRDFPFAKEENPLASQLIFLAEVVGAKVAAAAASAAMQELFEKGSILHQELLQAALAAAGLPPGEGSAHPELQQVDIKPKEEAAANGSGAGGTNAPKPQTESADKPATPAEGAENGNTNTVEDISAPIPDDRLYAAGAAAFLGAGTKAKQLAEAEGLALSGHAMTVLDAMTQKMVIKNKYLNDIESEIASVYSRLVQTRDMSLKERDLIAKKKKELEEEKKLLADAEKRHKAELAASGKTDLGKASDAKAQRPSQVLPTMASMHTCLVALFGASCWTSCCAIHPWHRIILHSSLV
jgi:hypothetical protein